MMSGMRASSESYSGKEPVDLHTQREAQIKKKNYGGN